MKRELLRRMIELKTFEVELLKDWIMFDDLGLMTEKIQVDEKLCWVNDELLEVCDRLRDFE